MSTQSCDNKSIQYTNESVAPYVTGWRFKAPYNDVAMAGSFTQVQHLEVRLVNWQVRGAEVDVEFIYSMLHSDNVNYPDWTDVWVTLELFAANPDSDVVLRAGGSVSAFEQGPFAKATAAAPAPTSWPYFFSGMTGFAMTVDHGSSAPFSQLGGSITGFGLQFFESDAAGVMEAELVCSHESEPQSAVSTGCGVDFVEVYPPEIS